MSKTIPQIPILGQPLSICDLSSSIFIISSNSSESSKYFSLDINLYSQYILRYLLLAIPGLIVQRNVFGPHLQSEGKNAVDVLSANVGLGYVNGYFRRQKDERE